MLFEQEAPFFHHGCNKQPRNGKNWKRSPYWKKKNSFSRSVLLQHEENAAGLKGERPLSPQARATAQEDQTGIDSSRKTTIEVAGRKPGWRAEDGKVGGPACARAVSAREL